MEKKQSLRITVILLSGLFGILPSVLSEDSMPKVAPNVFGNPNVSQKEQNETRIDALDKSKVAHESRIDSLQKEKQAVDAKRDEASKNGAEATGNVLKDTVKGVAADLAGDKLKALDKGLDAVKNIGKLKSAEDDLIYGPEKSADLQKEIDKEKEHIDGTDKEINSLELQNRQIDAKADLDAKMKEAAAKDAAPKEAAPAAAPEQSAPAPQHAGRDGAGSPSGHGDGQSLQGGGGSGYGMRE